MPAVGPADARTLPTLPLVPLQPEFAALVDDACASLSALLGDALDSLYVYGSVARGTARPGRSDLDLALILSRPLTPPEATALAQLRTDLQVRYPEVTKIDIDPGQRAEALAPPQPNAWAYWLKHECRCLWGDDLGARLAPFTPARALAVAINGDWAQVLAGYATRIAAAPTEGERLRPQKEAARKWLRATNVLRPPEGGDWPRTPHSVCASTQTRPRASPSSWLKRKAPAPLARHSPRAWRGCRPASTNRRVGWRWGDECS